MASPTLVAHRGFAGTDPQNTVRAVRRAGAHPETGMVEVDVQPAADGTPVVIHDSRLDTADDGGPGLTDGEGVVWETPLDEVTAAEVLGSGETVPTLAAVLDACPDDVRLNVELKNPGTHNIRPGTNLDDDALATQREVWRPFVERVLDDCAAAAVDVLFSSFCEAALAVAGDLGAHPTAALTLTNVDDAVAVAREHDCAALHPPLDVLLADDPRVDPWADPGDAGGVPDTRDTVLEAAADHGWAVNAWTVREWHEASRLAELGVDGLIADYPSVVAGD
ncbi:glycerophosphodiester phosphodiesterase [Haloglomus litoreum]|uniref:glycerophosphodiester phosphodiesterase n=1 Tax=Haloglomus litoreum TaxID=3034026 RepID=UPI0023E8537E|nr:glycerophosphodiester phosphodiesterase [Haloglomus sp. DT116]